MSSCNEIQYEGHTWREIFQISQEDDGIGFVIFALVPTPCATPCAFGPGSTTGYCSKKDCEWRTTGEGCPRPRVHTRSDGTKVV